jgi:hypothetical protein
MQWRVPSGACLPPHHALTRACVCDVQGPALTSVLHVRLWCMSLSVNTKDHACHMLLIMKTLPDLALEHLNYAAAIDKTFRRLL